MALWDLKVEFDVAEPRPSAGRLVVAADGTCWDYASSSNVWTDPVTQTMMLAPLPMTTAWRTTFSGNYARIPLSGYTLTTPSKWKQMQIKASGDYYIQSLGVTERVSVTSALPANAPMFVSLYVPGLKGMDEQIVAKLAYNYGGATSVEIWINGNGVALVLKNGVQVGRYEAGNRNLAPGTYASKPAANGQQFINLCIIPFRQRDMLVVSDAGINFVHTFKDLSIGSSNTILPAGNFSFLVPSGQASVQCAPCYFQTSGYALGVVKRLRYAPPVGATFTQTYATDIVGYGTISATGSVVKADGTAYTPDGTITDVRVKVALTGPGTGSTGVYEIDMVYQPASTTTYNGAVDVTSALKSLTLSVDEMGRGTISNLEVRRSQIDALGVQQSTVTNDRPVRVSISDGAGGYVDVMRGTLNSPKIRYEDADSSRRNSVFVYAGADRSRDFDYQWIVESYPYDGLYPDVAINDLLSICGYASTYSDLDSFTLQLPYTPMVSRGLYTLAPDYGDTVGAYLDKIHQDYYPTWIKGWMPTPFGYKYVWRNPATATTSLMTLYQSIDTAITAGVPHSLAYRRVVRNMTSHYEMPEATQVQIVGQDPSTGLFITRVLFDGAAETPTTAPAARPINWRGRPIMYQHRDPALTTQAAVDQAAQIIYNRITQGRILIEWESDFLILSTSNRPLWINDVVTIMEGDGTTVKGVYRIISISDISFVQETGGKHYRTAKYMGMWISG